MLLQRGKRHGQRAGLPRSGWKHNDRPQPRQSLPAPGPLPARHQLIKHREGIKTPKAVHGDEQHRIGLGENIAQLRLPVQDVKRHGHRPDPRDGVL